MNKEELEKELEDLEIVGLLDDMDINDVDRDEGNKEENEGIDDLIAGMEKVTIDQE